MNVRTNGTKRARKIDFLPCRSKNSCAERTYWGRTSRLSHGEHAVAGPPSDPVVRVVAQDGGDDQERDQHADVEHAGAGEGARDKEERVAGEERKDDEPGLDEDDQEEERVQPRRRTARPPGGGNRPGGGGGPGVRAGPTSVTGWPPANKYTSANHFHPAVSLYRLPGRSRDDRAPATPPRRDLRGRQAPLLAGPPNASRPCPASPAPPRTGAGSARFLRPGSS